MYGNYNIGNYGSSEGSVIINNAYLIGIVYDHNSFGTTRQ